MPKFRSLLAVAAVTCILALAAACSGGGRDTSDDSPIFGGTTNDVLIEDNTFTPGNLQVPVGASVTFTNADAAVHNARGDGGSFETDNLSDGESDTVMFDAPGEYRYICSLHPSMKARITVVEGEFAPYPTETPAG